jgi:hypothetical protein
VLTIGKIGGGDAGGRSVAYYTASVAKGRDDYYTGKGEAPGEWFGAGSGALGLVGGVDADDFQAVVMDATAPSGEVLRKLVGGKPVRGFATRMLWQAATADMFKARVGEATGREVLSVVSDFELDEELATEVFVLAPA